MNIGNYFRGRSLRGVGTANDPIDPFLGVDHAWMSAPTFPAHPHAGFSAVSYVFPDSETGINNTDSLGGHNIIQPGGLHWTAAGSGVVHEEFPAVVGKTVHSLQIFINLPLELQSKAPFTLTLAPEDVPVIQKRGVRIRLPLGAYETVCSPLTPPNDIALLDVFLESKAAFNFFIPSGQVAFVLVVSGTVKVNSQRFSSESSLVPVFIAQGGLQSISLVAGDDKAHVVVFLGAPLYQPVYWHGPMAMASIEALDYAVSAYKRGEFGVLIR